MPAQRSLSSRQPTRSAGRRAFSRPAAVTQRDVVSRRNPRSSSRQSRAIAASLAGNAHQLPGDAHQLCSVGGNRAAFSANRSPITHAKNTSNLGAPLRNRTVDLLLTIDKQEVPCNRRRGFEQAIRWLTRAAASRDKQSLAGFCPQTCPRFQPLRSGQRAIRRLTNRHSP